MEHRRKATKGFSIVLIIAIGAIIATFGWVAYASWQQSVDDSTLTLTIPFVKHKAKNVNTNSAANTNANANTNTATNTNVSTAGWKTYTNTDYHYSFKYPATWTLANGTSQDAALVTAQDPAGADGAFSVEPKSFPGTDAVQGTVTRSAVTVDGKAGTRIVTTNTAGRVLSDYITFAAAPATGWAAYTGQLHFERGTSTSATTLNTILSTFTFDETLGWKTYSNATHGYSIRYPQTWSVLEEANVRSTQLLPPGVSGTLSGENAIKGAITLKYLPTADETKTVINRKDTTINGVIAEQGSDPGITGFTATLIPKVSPKLKIDWATKYTNAEYNNILSTLQLTDETFGWKTYTNSDYSIQLKYPTDWTSKTINDPYYNNKAVLTSLQNPGFEEPYGAVGGIFVSVYANRNVTESLGAWFSKNRERTEEKILAGINGPCAGTAQRSDITVSITDETINGLATKAQYEKDLKPTYCEGGATTSKSYYIKKDTTIYEVHASSPTSVEANTLLATFDTIMSTFQFTQ